MYWLGQGYLQELLPFLNFYVCLRISAKCSLHLIREGWERNQEILGRDEARCFLYTSVKLLAPAGVQESQEAFMVNIRGVWHSTSLFYSGLPNELH